MYVISISQLRWHRQKALISLVLVRLLPPHRLRPPFHHHRPTPPHPTFYCYFHPDYCTHNFNSNQAEIMQTKYWRVNQIHEYS